MKKQVNKSKIAKIIIFALVVLLLATIGILAFIIPAQLKEFLSSAWVWLNEPLPIVGVSILVVCLFAWRVISTSSIGKRQLAIFKREKEEVEDQFNEWKKVFIEALEKKDEEIQNLNKKLDFYIDFTEKVVAAIPNSKVRKIGESFHAKEREETANNETETE